MNPSKWPRTYLPKSFRQEVIRRLEVYAQRNICGIRFSSLTPKHFESITPNVRIVAKAINNIKAHIVTNDGTSTPESKLKQLVSQTAAKAD